MDLHRFYVNDIHDKWGPLKLDHDVWIHDEELLNQWLNVLHLKLGSQLVLFNDEVERIYFINNIELPGSVHLKLLTEETRKMPAKHIYLIWALLDEEENNWILQKATRLGVRNFVPILNDSIETSFDINSSHKIVIEAAQQCGRADIPEIRQPINMKTALIEYADLPLFVCREGSKPFKSLNINRLGLLINPLAGWSDQEKSLLKSKKINYIDIADIKKQSEAAIITQALQLLYKI